MTNENDNENTQTTTLYLCELDPETLALRACLETLICDAPGFQVSATVCRPRPHGMMTCSTPSRKIFARMRVSQGF